MCVSTVKISKIVNAFHTDLLFVEFTDAILQFLDFTIKLLIEANKE